METIEYGQGPLPFEIPPDAVHTEIIPYLWPGHYGEWDDAGQEFTAWKLVSPSMWHVTWDFPSPPRQAVVGATVQRLRFRLNSLTVTDPPSASQEFHVELRRSSQLSDPSPTDQLGTTHPPELESMTHPGSQSKKHPGSQSKKHPESQSKKHPGSQSKKHPGLESVQAKAPMKDQLAVWRIHTGIHKS